MKRIFATYSVLLAGLIAGGPADAQPASSPTGQKTLAATVGLYAFPADGQSPEKQNREEAECYSWAVNNTKTDPFNLAKRLRQTEAAAEHEKEHIAESGKGAGAKGALGGAAVGALIGEIASDDAGGGAALGAAAGLIAGRRKARKAKQGATHEVEAEQAQHQQATAAQIEDFKKAFSICLEAKKYLVRY